MKIYGDETLKRRRLLSLPGITLLFLVSGAFGGFVLVGMIIGLRLGESPVMSGVNRWLLDTFIAKRVVTPGIYAASTMMTTNLPWNFLEGVAYSTAEPMELDVKWEDYQALTRQRETALKEGILFAKPSDYVPVQIRYQGENYRGKARLKGRLPDHWSTDKWSLRFKLKGNTTLLGMNRFAIQAPETRQFLGEAIALELMRQEDLIAVQYRFVDVSINGVAKGLYALEETLDKHLLERSRRREGPILRFDNDAALRSYGATGDFEAGSGEFTASPITGQNRDAGPGSSLERAAALLEAFRAGRVPASRVFHIERLATFTALREIIGAKEMDWRDMRLYFDPIRSRFEPIGYDNHAGAKITKLFCDDGGIYSKGPKTPPELLTKMNFVRLLFQDRAFAAAYAAALQRVSRPEYLEQFFAKHGERLQKSLINIHADYPYVGSPAANFVHNGKFIRKQLEGLHSLHVYRHDAIGQQLTVLAGNTQSLSVEIVGLSVGGGSPVRPTTPVVLGSKRRAQALDFVKVVFEAPTGTDWTVVDTKTLAVAYRFVGTKRLMHTTLYEWSCLPPVLPEADWMADTKGFRSTPGVVVDDTERTVTLSPGKRVLDKNLVIPAGYTVHAAGGVHLDLRNGAKLLSYSPLLFEGTAVAPVIIESSDETGQGLVVLDAPGESRLSNVRFLGLGTPTQDGWLVPGAVTFYESDVTMSYVQFKGGRSEDDLNVVRARVTLDHVSFVDAHSDAFDGDFVSGTAKKCTFLRSGNDGIDLSGSVFSGEDLTFDHIGDKAISAGENSQVKVQNLKISDTELGCISKDASRLTVRGIEFLRTRVAFVSFQKKSEFSSGWIHATGCKLVDVEVPHLVEKGSHLAVNGAWVAPNHNKVEPLLYGGKYGRRSK